MCVYVRNTSVCERQTYLKGEMDTEGEHIMVREGESV